MDQKDNVVNNSSYSSGTIATHTPGNELKSSTPFTFIVQMSLPLVSIIIFICEVLAIRLLSRCKTLPYQCLRLSLSYLLSDIIGAFIYVISFICIHSFYFKTDLAQNLQIILVSIVNNISSASLTAIILERVIALKANLNYTLRVKRVKIHVAITLLWVLHVLIPLCVFTVSYGHQCNFHLNMCDIWQVSRPTKYTCLVIMCIYDVILVKANIFIYKIAKGHVNQINALQSTSLNVSTTNIKTVSKRQYDSLHLCMKLVSVYVLLKAPMLVLMLISTNFEEIREYAAMRILRAIAYILIKICSVINLYLYVWKVQECKMFCYTWLAKYLKKFEQIAQDKRIEVYNIVVAFNRNDRPS